MIDMDIIKKAEKLTAKEFKFIRKALDLSQNDMALLFRVNEQTIARYEKDEVGLPGPIDRLARTLFVIWMVDPKHHGELLDGLFSLRQYK